jgi:hypothetical protein
MQGLIPTMPMKQHIIAIGIISNSDAQFIPTPPWYKPENSIDPKKELNKP